jgi:uncharacterized protein with HEPN domain
MSKKNLRIQDYIEHIIEAIVRIEGYVKDYDADVFIEVNLVQDAVIRNIEIIGEAASNIKSVDSSFLEKYPQLKLEQAYRMRNALAHGYYSVNLRTVWNTVKNDLPVLKQQMLDIQRGMHDI